MLLEDDSFISGNSTTKTAVVMSQSMTHLGTDLLPRSSSSNDNTSTTHWIKNPLQRTSEHNHKCNYLNFSFFH